MRQNPRTTEDPLWQLKPSAASEIVKAARASLKEPTRPVTPADAGRRLLQGDGFESRPHTPGGQVSSREFLQASSTVLNSRPCSSLRPASAAAGEAAAAPWRISCEAASAADVWRADEGPSRQPYSAASPGGGISTITSYAQPAPMELQAAACRNFDSKQLPALPSSRRVSNAAQPGMLLRPSSASADTGFSAGRATAAVTHSITALTLAGVAEGPAAPAAAAATAARSWSRLGAPTSEAIVSAPAADDSAWPTSAPVVISANQGAGVLIGSSTQGYKAPMQGIPSRVSISNGAGKHSSRGSSRGSSRLSSSGSTGDDMFPPAGTEEESAAAQATAMLQWQQQAVLALQQLSSLPVSPAASDAAALLKACAVLQTLLDVAEDQQHLQEWLATPAHLAMAAAAAAGPDTGQHVQNGSSGDMRGLIAAALVRLVDCPKADVVVKVACMLLRVLPASGSMMLTASKLLYRLSKDSSNDIRFRHHGVIRPLLAVVAQLSKPCTACSQAQQQSAATEVEQQQAHRTLLYFTGALKNISADAANQKALGRLGAVAAMAQVLDDQGVLLQQSSSTSEAQAQQQSQRQQEAAAHVCEQATAVLRNLAVYPGHAPLFLQQQGLPLRVLLQLVPAFGQLGEVALNVSRCLSKLSMQGLCREAMLQQQLQPMHLSQHNGIHCSSYSSDPPADTTAAVPCLLLVLLTADTTHISQRPLVLRVAFVLGNLTTHHPQARAAVADMPNALAGVVRLGLALLQCAEQEQEQQQASSQSESDQTATMASAAEPSKVTVEDLLVKLLRLLGNTAINETAGGTLAGSEEAVQLVAGVLQGYEFEQQEELVLNAAAAVTNLVFYQQPGNKFFSLEPSVLLKPLLPLLTSGNDEAVIEAARAVSNLARASPAVQAVLLHCGCEVSGDAAGKASGDVHEELAADSLGSIDAQDSSSTSNSLLVGEYVLQALVLLLGHSSWEVVYNVAGALLNLTAVTGRAAALQKVHLVQQLCDALQRTLSSLPCNAEVSQQQQLPAGNRAPLQAAASKSDIPWMLEAAELVLQCLANMVATQTSVMEAASAAAAASGHAMSTASAGVNTSMGWDAAAQLMDALEVQFETSVGADSCLCGLVQLVKMRLSSNAGCMG